MEYVYYHLSERVNTWLEGYLVDNRGHIQWLHSVDVVCKPFGANTLSIEEEFKLLRQIGGVEEFTEKYEDMRVLMLLVHHYLTEDYFLNCYISCLNRTIRCFVKTGRLRTLL